MLRRVVFANWIALMAAAMGLPSAFRSPSVGADRVVETVRISLICYFAAAAMMLITSSADWKSNDSRVRTAKLFWSLGCLTQLIHVALAFHYYHHWSQSAAEDHTREISGFGEGIFISYFFLVLWCLDSLSWWIWPEAYVRRSSRLAWCIHGFMAFIIFNGAVVYASGLIRWVAATMFTLLATLLAWRFKCVSWTVERTENRAPA